MQETRLTWPGHEVTQHSDTTWYSPGFTGYAAGGCGLTGWTGCTTATGSVAAGAEPVKRGREQLDFLTANTRLFQIARDKNWWEARQYGYQTHWWLSGTSDNASWLVSAG